MIPCVSCEYAGAPSTAIVRDSVGIRIVTVDPSIDLPTWTVDSIATLEVGQRPNDPAHQLFRVRAAVRMDDGTLVLSNTGTNEIRLFDSAGRYRRTLGREGDGPGEFRWLASVLRGGSDSVLAFDRALQRVTVFGVDGNVIGTIPVPATRAGSIGRLADGSFVETQFLSGMPRRPRGVHHDTAAIAIYRAGASPDTIARAVVFEWFSHAPEGTPSPLPYGRATYVAPTGPGLTMAPSDQLELRRYSIDGRLEQIVRVTQPPAPVTDVAWERAREEWMSTARPETRPAYEARWSDLPRPRHLPMTRGLLSDRDGNAWLREFSVEPAASQWWVFTGSGEPLARVRFPPDITILAVDRTFVIGHRDDPDRGERVGVFLVRR